MTDDMWQADAKPHGPRGTKGVIITILKVCFRDDAGFASLRPSRHDPVVWEKERKKQGEIREGSALNLGCRVVGGRFKVNRYTIYAAEATRAVGHQCGDPG
jgi:hypothetical protein